MRTPGYYLDSVDGESDIYVCADCVIKHGKSTDRPVDPDVLAWTPLGCGFHWYGGNPEEYV